MARGGKRTGAGTPKGNLNALKSGRHSLQLRAVLDAMPSRDEIRPILLAIIEKRREQTLRFQALVLATAKLIHNTELAPAIVRKLHQYLESEGQLGESEKR